MAFLSEAGFFGDIGKGSIAIVVVENDSAPVGHNQIVEAVVIVVSDAASLPPTGARQTSLFGHVGESSVPVVVEQKVCGRLGRIDAF